MPPKKPWVPSFFTQTKNDRKFSKREFLLRNIAFILTILNPIPFDFRHPEWKVGQIAQELGKQWKTLTEEDRQFYERKASDDKQRYDLEMREYRAMNGSAAIV